MNTIRRAAVTLTATAALLTSLAAPAFADTETAMGFAKGVLATAMSAKSAYSPGPHIVTNKDITSEADGIMVVPVDLMGSIAGYPRMAAFQMAWWVDMACITFPAKLGAAPIQSPCPASVKAPATMATVIADEALFLANGALYAHANKPVTLAAIQSVIPGELHGSIKATAVAGVHPRDVKITISSDTVRPTAVCIYMPTTAPNNPIQSVSSVTLVGPNGTGSC